VGIAIEIEGGTKFDRHYGDVVRAFTEDHDIDLAHSILKTDDVLERVSSYDLRDESDRLMNELLSNPAIDRIYCVIGWFDRDVSLPWKTNSMSGIQYSNSYLSQIFPIVTLWKYFEYFEDRTGVPNDAWVDNVQGKITGAWYISGGHFDLSLVPHGDVTYPSLSTADIVAGHLSRTLPKDRNLDELHRAAYGHLDNVTESSVEVQADFVNEEDAEMIVPEYPYSIQEELYWPHPCLFLHDEIFKDYDRALARTDFHAYARMWARENRGSVVKLQPEKLPSILKDGDYIVYTDGSSEKICETLQDLNPTKDTTLLDSTQFLQMVA
jgi:hypothetical protein